MFNPTYLQLSRHGIFYFRWRIPTESKGLTGSLRVSLKTREPRQALQLAMPLSYLARTVTVQGLRSSMDHKQLRIVLREHFDRFLTQKKVAIDADGPLSPSEQELLRKTAALAELQLRDGPIDADECEAETTAFSNLYGLGIELRTAKFEALKRSLLQAQRDFAHASLDYSAQSETFDYSERGVSHPIPKATKQTGLTLCALVAEYQKVVEREGRWAEKTGQERLEHLNLLYERIGKDIPALAVGREQANDIRDVLMSYPVNRHKSERTRGKPLEEVISDPSLKKLHNRTVNKYLNTYNGLFNWACRSGHCQSNPFEGLSLRADKAEKEPPRLPFEPDQLSRIIRALLDNTANRQQHHKWGTLLAIYSGARLNEIAQLYLCDIRNIDDIWCIDINENKGTLKKLKNRASKRVVPIHPKLLDYGFLEYVDRTRNLGNTDRLFPQLSYSKSDGFGRNLGRWVNETFLPDLNLKTNQLTFHSFRHTVVGALFNAEVAEPHVMAIVGHEPGTTTLKTYNRNGFAMHILLSAIQRIFDDKAEPMTLGHPASNVDISLS